MASKIKPIPVLQGAAARKFLDTIDKNFKRKLSGAERATRRRQKIRMVANYNAIIKKSNL